MKVRVCAVQSVVHKDRGKNLEEVRGAFHLAARRRCQFICFPEIFLCGPHNEKTYDPSFLNKAKQVFSELSKKYRMYSIMGSIVERKGGKLCNTSYLFDDRGKLKGVYSKNYLTKPEKKRGITPGRRAPVFSTKYGKIGIQICLDLLYPELTKDMVRRGAQIIFSPSYWASTCTTYPRRYTHHYYKNKVPIEVDVLSSARAIENAVFFIYVNAAGNYAKGGVRTKLLGKTQIASPFYGQIARLNHNKKMLLIHELDLKRVRDGKRVYGTHK